MDRKSILILLVSLVLLLWWYPMIDRWFPAKEIDLADAQTTTNTVTPPSLTEPVSTAPTRPTELTAPGEEPPALVTTSQPEESLLLETEDAIYTFTSLGGGLKEISLKDYPAEVGRKTRDLEESQNLATLNGEAPVPAFALLGDRDLQGDGVYTLTKDGDSVRASKELANGLRIVKEFTPLTNHLMSVKVSISSQTNRPVTLSPRECVFGTATPIDGRDKGTFMGLLWFNGSKAEQISESWFANRTLGCFPGTPRERFSAGESNVVWAAVHNQFFTMAAIPAPESPAPRIVSRKVDLPPPSPQALAEDKKLIARPFGFQTSFQYPGQVLEAGQSLEQSYTLFAGPKEYRTLDRIGNRLDNRLDLIMGYTGFFGFFAKALLLSMNGVHAVGLSYGLSIIVITIIIKLLFWPLTQISTRSMKRMQALQPQMKALQEKYKEDPQKMNRKMMEFMRENKVNPAAGCLPILIQLPIFIGFFRMIQSAIELRGASFLWVADLSRPDTIFVIPGLEFPINPLPIIMGATQLWQARLTPPSPGADPVQQKMLQFMPLIFLFILYNFSSGLTLYWTVQNLLQIVQMKLTKSTDPKAAVAITPPKKAATKAPKGKKA